MAMAMARSSQTALCRARVSASRKNAETTCKNRFGSENIHTAEAHGAAAFGYPPTLIRTLHGVCIYLRYNILCGLSSRSCHLCRGCPLGRRAFCAFKQQHSRGTNLKARCVNSGASLYIYIYIYIYISIYIYIYICIFICISML